MKRILKILALCLALAVLAACAGRGGDAGDFGNTERTLSTAKETISTAERIPISDCSGDTDFIEATSYYFTTWNGAPELGVCFSGEHDAAVTEKVFEDGMQTSRVRFDNPVTMERLEDGEWVDLKNIRPDKLATVGGVPDYVVLPCGGSRILLPFPIHESGTYRLTYKMRESTGDYSTGDTLYSISHTVTVPEATDSRFDIVSVDYIGQGGVYVAIRPNTDGAALYLDRARGTIEKKSDGGEYTDITDTDVGLSMNLLPEDDEGRYYDTATEPRLCGYDDLFMFRQFLTLKDAGEYRLTLFFTRNPDGTGEQYTLRLNLKFGE